MEGIEERRECHGNKKSKREWTQIRKTEKRQAGNKMEKEEKEE